MCFFFARTWTEDLSVSPFESHNQSRMDTTPYHVLTHLYSGQVYSISARAYWVINGSLTIYGFYAPVAIEQTGLYPPLVENAQSAFGDPVLVCTCK